MAKPDATVDIIVIDNQQMSIQTPACLELLTDL